MGGGGLSGYMGQGMRGLEGVGGGGLSGCMGQRDYMRGGGLFTPSGVVGLRINLKMTFTRN